MLHDYTRSRADSQGRRAQSLLRIGKALKNLGFLLLAKISENFQKKCEKPLDTWPIIWYYHEAVSNSAELENDIG
jgi:hypothetical protein